MVNIIISSDTRYQINHLAIQKSAINVLKDQKVTGAVEIGVNIVGNRKMRQLNKKHRGLDKTTDVLSFALEDTQPQYLQPIPRAGFVAAPDAILRLGDIVICYPQALACASTGGTSVEDAINFLVDHGTKHLLGIHHQ